MRGGGRSRATAALIVACALQLLVWPAHGSYPGREGEILYAGGPKGWDTISALDPSSGASRVVATNTTGQASGSGETIAFVRRIPGSLANPPEESIWISEDGGDDPHQILAGFTVISDVAVSRDGGTVAFTAADFTGNGPLRAGLFKVDADGSGLDHLSGADNAGGLDMSPDGRRIAFHVFEGRTCDEATDSDVHLIGVNGGRERVLAGHPNRSEYSPSFAPHGRSIAYRRGEKVGPCKASTMQYESIRVVDLAGRRDRRVAPRKPKGPSRDAPLFSPSGERIAYFRDGRIAVTRLGGGRERTLPGQSGRAEYYPLAWLAR